MALKISILFLLIPLFLSAKGLPELLTKQDVNNLRFFSADSKFTIYQKRSGDLILSTNFSVKELVKGEKDAQYLLISSPARKKIIISKDNYFHSYLNIKKNNELFITNWGSSEARPIGSGQSPQLHLNDQWLSFYNPYTRKLHFQQTATDAINFDVVLANKFSPYFIPQAAMTTDQTILYTDLNEQGIPAVFRIDRSQKKPLLLIKGLSRQLKYEICLNNQSIFIGAFDLNNSGNGSTIFKIDRKSLDFDKKEIVYNSPRNDIGNMICQIDEKHIYFIKNFSSDNAILESDIAKLDLNSKSVERVSDYKNIYHLINMDGTLITKRNGKFLIALGSSDFKSTDKLGTGTRNIENLEDEND